MQYRDLSEQELESHESYDLHETVRVVELTPSIKTIIAVHNTALGPGLGGCRMRAYASEKDALYDVLRLSRGMTYKNAMAGLPLGGGKSVIIGDPARDKTPALMETMGEAVDSLEGDYVTAEDSGTTEADMVAMAAQTDFVTGLPPEFFEGKEFGELGGNPSPLTALGVYSGIKSALAFRNGSDALDGARIAVQGVGAVGLELCKLLRQAGAKLIIADVNAAAVDAARAALGEVEVAAPDAIHAAEADIFSPCALGGVLNDDTIPQIKARVIAGAANNQLRSPYHDGLLAERSILYVPDYVINAGGVICVAYEYFRRSGYNPYDFDITRESMIQHVESIGATVSDVLTHAEADKMYPGEAADAMAEARFRDGAARKASSEPPSSFGQGGGRTLVQ